jgi:hypothetical protein
MRANLYGSPCPEWCTTDHSLRIVKVPGGQDYDFSHDAHSSTSDPVIVLSAPGGVSHAIACASQTGTVGVPSPTHITVIAGTSNNNSQAWTSLDPSAADAYGIAGLIEAMAQATPEQHMQLAAQLRDAASIVASESAR